MKSEEYRHCIPELSVLPKAVTSPCVRGVLDVELYNRTGEIRMIEPFQEYVPPAPADDVVSKKAEAMKRRRPIVNCKRPSKEALEKLLRLGMSAPEIAEKYDSAKITVYNWIKSYGLQGIKGQKNPVEKPPSVGDDFNIVADQARRFKEIFEKPILEDMVQKSPTLAEIEQFHIDNEVQALPKVEFNKTFNIITDNPKDSFADLVSDCAEDGKTKDCAAAADKPGNSPAPLETIDEIWLNVHDDLATLEMLYVAQAKKSFRERLADLVIAVAGHRDNKPQESKHE